MSTNIDFKLQNNSPLIEQQDPAKAVSDNEDITPSEAIQNEESTNSVLNEYLKTWEREKNLNHLSLAHFIFCDFFNILNDKDTSDQIEVDGFKALMNLFVLIHGYETKQIEKEKFNDLKNEKVNELFSIILKSKAYPIYKTSIENAKEVLIKLDPDKLIANRNNKSSPSSLPGTMGIVFSIIKVILNSTISTNQEYFNREKQIIENSANKLPKGTNYFDYISIIFKINFLKDKDNLTFSQIEDLTKFLENMIDNNFKLNEDLFNFTSFYVRIFTNILGEFNSSSNEKQIEMGEELFKHIKVIKKKKQEIIEKALYSEIIPTAIFYLFHKTKPNELKDIFEKCKNFHSLSKELEDRIKNFNKELQKKTDLTLLREYIQFFLKNPFLGDLKAMYLSETKRFRLIASFLDVLSFIDSTKAEILFNDHIKKTNQKSKQSVSPPLPSRAIRQNESKEISDADKDHLIGIAGKEEIKSPTPNPHIVSSSEPAVSKPSLQVQLQSIHEQILKMTSNEGPSTTFAKNYFDNSRLYILNMIHLLSRFVRDSEKGMTKVQISSHAVNMVINGTLAIEQAYTSILAQRKKCKNMEQISPYLTHNLLDLYNHCEFSGSFAPAKKDVDLLLETNGCEIGSRNIPQLHIPSTNARARELLDEAYSFVQHPNKDSLENVLKESNKYCRDIIMSFTRLQQFLSKKVPAEQYKNLHDSLVSFASDFNAQNQHLRFANERPSNAHLQILEENLNLISKNLSSYSLQERFNNLKFLNSLHQAEMASISSNNPQEIGMIYSRSLQLNQIILEEFLYLIIEMQGKRLDRSSIDHHLDILLDKTGYKLDLSAKEQEFLKTGKDIRSMTRYGTGFLKEDKAETTIAKTTKKSRNLSKHKSGKAIPTKSDSDGFAPVVKPMDKKMENKVKQIQEMILLDCSTLNNILQKLTDLPEFKNDFKLKS